MPTRARDEAERAGPCDRPQPRTEEPARERSTSAARDRRVRAGGGARPVGGRSTLREPSSPGDLRARGAGKRGTRRHAPPRVGVPRRSASVATGRDGPLGDRRVDPSGGELRRLSAAFAPVGRRSASARRHGSRRDRPSRVCRGRRPTSGAGPLSGRDRTPGPIGPPGTRVEIACVGVLEPLPWLPRLVRPRGGTWRTDRCPPKRDGASSFSNVRRAPAIGADEHGPAIARQRAHPKTVGSGGEPKAGGPAAASTSPRGRVLRGRPAGAGRAGSPHARAGGRAARRKGVEPSDRPTLDRDRPRG